jgi:hypothetical protein
MGKPDSVGFLRVDGDETKVRLLAWSVCVGCLKLCLNCARPEQLREITVMPLGAEKYQ